MKAIADGSGNISAIGPAVDGVEVTGTIPADWHKAVAGKYTLVDGQLVEDTEWSEPAAPAAPAEQPGWEGFGT